MKNFYTILSRGYGHKPAIKFVGKRSAIQHKHIMTHQENPSHNIEHIKQSLSVCPISTANMRPKFTQEEIDHINNGGPLTFKDWNKIKVKTKK